MSITFFAKTSRECAQLRGFLCAPSSGRPGGAGKLVPGSIRCPKSTAAVRFSILIVVVDVMCCFCFAETFCRVLCVFNFLQFLPTSKYPVC